MEVRMTEAARLYETTRPLLQEPPAAQLDPERTGQVAGDFVQMLRESEAVATDAMLGRADPQALVQALAQTELAVEAAVALRNKVVEAYQEILRMPV